MFMMFWFFVGIVAAVLTMFGFIPQIIRMYRTRSVKDISVLTLVQFALGVALWAVYGVFINDFIVVGANVVSLATLIVALVFYFHYQGIPIKPDISAEG